MMYYVLLCNIAFIPLICSAVVKTGNTNSSFNLTNTHVKNETKVLLSEGGSLLDEVAELSLPSNNTIYKLDFETGKTKGSVVARKGVPPLLPSSQSSSITSDESIDTHKELNKTNITPIKHLVKPLTSPNVSVPITTTVRNISKKIETTHKKPPVLSYDKLMETANNASPASFVNNQINSPNKDMKIYMSSDVNSHPGMVMPIVITILLVPMFAVLGFMALRRGQEAWKNRHYKRMDFLLDGMYND